jgi:hypothetical protein
MVAPGATVLGEVTLTSACDGSSVRVAGPPGDGDPFRFEATCEQLREWVRTDARGRYRPLPGARTMRQGWEATVRGESVAAVAGAIYPLAEEHCAQATTGTLRVLPLAQVLGRQTGRYRLAVELDSTGRKAAARVLCGQCVKQPLWRGDQWDGESIPCPEPCSVLVSLCREAAAWQTQPPASHAPNPNIAYAAFDEPGNELREAYLRTRYGAAEHE